MKDETTIQFLARIINENLPRNSEKYMPYNDWDRLARIAGGCENEVATDAETPMVEENEPKEEN